MAYALFQFAIRLYRADVLCDFLQLFWLKVLIDISNSRPIGVIVDSKKATLFMDTVCILCIRSNRLRIRDLRV